MVFTKIKLEGQISIKKTKPLVDGGKYLRNDRNRHFFLTNMKFITLLVGYLQQVLSDIFAIKPAIKFYLPHISVSLF